MRRWLVLVFLLLSVFWQALAVAGQSALAGTAEDLEHVALHWTEASHHHHDEGGYHEDDSQDSVKHVVLDAALGGPALVSQLLIAVPQLATDPPLAQPDRQVPAPYLDRLRRPPRLTA